MHNDHLRPWRYNHWAYHLHYLPWSCMFWRVPALYLWCARPSPDCAVSYGRERSTLPRSLPQCPVGGQCVWTREGKRRAVKTPGFTLCHFEENRPTSAFSRVRETQVMTRISELPLWTCEYFLPLVALRYVFDRAAIVQVTLETTWKVLFFSVDCVCCQPWLGCCVSGACWAQWNVCKVVCNKSNAELQLYSDFASQQRRRSGPRSGPQCPGWAWLCCGWQHAGAVFFLQSELLWAEEKSSCLPVTRVFVRHLVTPRYKNALKQQRVKMRSATSVQFICTCRRYSFKIYTCVLLRGHFNVLSLI